VAEDYSNPDRLEKGVKSLKSLEK